MLADHLLGKGEGVGRFQRDGLALHDVGRGVYVCVCVYGLLDQSFVHSHYLYDTSWGGRDALVCTAATAPHRIARTPATPPSLPLTETDRPAAASPFSCLPCRSDQCVGWMDGCVGFTPARACVRLPYFFRTVEKSKLVDRQMDGWMDGWGYVCVWVWGCLCGRPDGWTKGRNIV